METTPQLQEAADGGSQHPLVRYLPEQVKAAMIAADLHHVRHHDCGCCGGWVGYIREGDQLFFDPSCDCACGNGPEPRSWADASDWLNMQSDPAAQMELAARFGLANGKGEGRAVSGPATTKKDNQ